MKFHLNRTIDIRETGLVLQPKLFWLAASPDGLVSDKSNEDVRQIGLIEIKCPKSKKNSKINDLVHDQSFYVKYDDGVPLLKKDQPNGYDKKIQMAMGLSQTGLWVIRPPTHRPYNRPSAPGPHKILNSLN